MKATNLGNSQLMDGEEAEMSKPVLQDGKRFTLPRDDFIGIVESTLQYIRQESAPRVLVLWGGPGAGKTTLLSLITEKLKSKAEVLLGGPWDADAQPFDQLMKQLLEVLKQDDVSGDKTQQKLLLIDNIDSLLITSEGEGFYILEHSVLLPLSRRGDTLIIVTSRSEVQNWRELGLFEYVRDYAIPKLTYNEAAFLAQGNKVFVSDLYERTMGHPQLISWLCQKPDLSDPGLAQMAAENWLSDLPRNLWPFTLRTSLLPRFNINILRKVLQLNQPNSGLYVEYLKNIQELGKRGWIAWEVENGYYHFIDPLQRKILANSILGTDPQVCQSVYQCAFNYFADLSMVSVNLRKVLVSAVYHLAKWKHLTFQDVPTACLEWIKENSQTWVDANWVAVRESWLSGGDDEIVVSELKILLGPAYESITLELEKNLALAKGMDI